MSSLDSSEPLRRRIAPPVLALLLVTGFAGWFVDASYDDVRPPVEPAPVRALGRVGAVGSLATEDPLTVARRGIAESLADDSARLAARFAARQRELQSAQELLRSNERGEVLLLVVWQPGGDWREDAERRRRDRHAVITAMAAADFALAERRRTHFVEFARSNVDPEGGPVLAALDVFDRMESRAAYDVHSSAQRSIANSRNERCGRVVVMWLEEDGLGRRPLSRVLEIQAQLLANAELGPPWPCQAPSVEVQHLGPSGSTMLGAILEELESTRTELSQIRFVSPFATERSKVEKMRSTCVTRDVVSFQSEIGTDDMIAQLLVGELFQRLPRLDDALASGMTEGEGDRAPALLRALHFATGGVVGRVEGDFQATIRRITSNSDALVQVAIVAEQDSAYGRHWKETMRAAVKELVQKNRHFRFVAHIDEKCPKADFPIRFQLVPYIGVIDGASEGVREDRRDYPYGASQIDYLQRLERDLAGERFDAIGIFGSDVSDTLAILHALRPRFPGVLFFTTDLDARYLHKAHLPYTRNLIVGSHFALDDAGTTLHFRDAYEHSLFRAVATIVGVRDTLACRCEPTPHLFEIGRSELIELNTPWLSSGATLVSERDSPTPTAIQFANTLFESLTRSEVRAGDGQEDLGPLPHPLFEAGQAWSILLVLTLFWLVLCRFVWATSKRVQLWLRTRPRRIVLGAALPVFVLLTSVFVAELQLAARLSVMEPLVLTQGVSAWGAVGLLLVSAAVGLLGMVVIRRRCVALYRRGLEQFGFRPAPRGASVEFLESFSFVRSRPEQVSLEELWSGFSSSVRARWTLLRAGCAVVLVWGATNLIANLDHSAVAERGLVATFLHEWAERIALIVFVALVYLVAELTVVSIRMAAQISKSKRVWFVSGTPRDDRDTRAPEGLLRLRERQELAAEFLNFAEGLPRMPAIVLCVFVLARAPALDAWMWSDSAIAVLVGAFLVIGLCGWRVRRAQLTLRSEHEQSLNELGEHLARQARPASERASVRRASEHLRRSPAPSLLRTPYVGPLLGPAATFGISLLSDPAVLQWAAGLSGVSF